MFENLLKNGTPAGSASPQSLSPTVVEHACIGPSITIKGEISGDQPLFVDGVVEGAINFPNHRVTVGRTSKVQADIKAHDVIVMGGLRGNVVCGDLLDVRAESSIIGEIVAQRIRVDDGAVLKGSVEVHVAQPEKKIVPGPVTQPVLLAKANSPFAKPATEPPKSAALPPSKPPANEPAKTGSAAGPAKPVKGSSVILEPTR